MLLQVQKFIVAKYTGACSGKIQVKVVKLQVKVVKLFMKHNSNVYFTNTLSMVIKI